MKQLTKRFRVIHIGNKLVTDEIEYGEGSITFPAEGVTAEEFDTQKEAVEYINENKLVYEDESEE